MCTTSCIEFGAANLARDEIEGKRIIELGSLDIDGSLRHIITPHNPAEYIGVDIEKGLGVDIVCDACDITARFGEKSFDVVVSTELLEHVKNWRQVISNIKNICKPKGTILLTTRSHGFHYHGYPNDFWRYEVEDMKNIFSDFTIKKLEKDRLCPGAFMKAERPAEFVENDLSGYALYSIIANKKIGEIDEKSVKHFQKRYKFFEHLKKKINKIEKVVHKISKFILFRRQDYIA